jgi:hypothetical protein
MSTAPFTEEETRELQMYAAHYRSQAADGKVDVQLNFHEGKLSVVVVNGRRFKRPEEA